MESVQKTERGGERGAVTAITALGMTLLLGAAAIAVDLGHLYNVRTEAQQAADLSALAGVGAFISASGSSPASTVRAFAIDFASRNVVDQAAVVLPLSDIDVNVLLQRVDVTVNNTQARGTGVSTVFARVFGVGQVDIVAKAAAQAYPASAVQCLLPLFLVDKWDERGGNPNEFDASSDYYEAYHPAVPTSTYTGYDKSDIGARIRLLPAQGPPHPAGQPNSSWYYPFDSANIPSGAGYSESIVGCPADAYAYSLFQSVWIQPGANILSTPLGFVALIASDPNAAWDPTLECVMDSSNVGLGNPAHCRASPRLRPVPLYDPAIAPTSGTQQVAVTNLAGMFVEQVVGIEIWVVLTGYSGLNPVGIPSSSVMPPLLNVARLIE